MAIVIWLSCCPERARSRARFSSLAAARRSHGASFRRSCPGRFQQDTVHRTESRATNHDDLSSNSDTAIKIDDMRIQHADASVTGILANGLRSIGSVNGVFAASERKGTSTHRVLGRAAGDEVGKLWVVPLYLRGG